MLDKCSSEITWFYFYFLERAVGDGWCPPCKLSPKISTLGKFTLPLSYSFRLNRKSAGPEGMVTTVEWRSRLGCDHSACWNSVTLHVFRIIVSLLEKPLPFFSFPLSPSGCLTHTRRNCSADWEGKIPDFQQRSLKPSVNALVCFTHFKRVLTDRIHRSC